MPNTPMEELCGSDGVASLAADTPVTFTFGSKGNRIILSCEAGGLFRVAWDGSSPSTTITTLEATSRFALCDANENIIDINPRVLTDTVTLHCKSAVTNLGVSLCRV